MPEPLIPRCLGAAIRAIKTPKRKTKIAVMANAHTALSMTDSRVWYLPQAICNGGGCDRLSNSAISQSPSLRVPSEKDKGALFKYFLRGVYRYVIEEEHDLLEY